MLYLLIGAILVMIFAAWFPLWWDDRFNAKETWTLMRILIHIKGVNHDRYLCQARHHRR